MSDHTLTILGIILGLLGIGVGLPGLIQFVWGGPDLSIEFETYWDQESELIVKLTNRPIRSRWLLAWGFSRSGADITGDHRVISPKGKTLEEGPITFRRSWGQYSPHVTLSGEQFVYIVVATHYHENKYATLGPGSEDSESIILRDGNYIYDFNLSIGGRRKSVRRWFRFSKRGLTWIDDEPIE